MVLFHCLGGRQVNYLSHFLLVHELLRLSKSEYTARSIRPRCVFLSSLTHYGGTLDTDLDKDLQAKESYNGFKSYANSKLCQLLVAKEFNRQMDGEGMFPAGTATACHPGIVDTALARQYFLGELPMSLRPFAAPLLESY